MKVRQRMLALMLSVMMIVTYMPAIAFAETDEATETDVTEVTEVQADEEEAASEEEPLAEEGSQENEAVSEEGLPAEEKSRGNEAVNKEEPLAEEEPQEDEPEVYEDEDPRVVVDWSYSKKGGNKLQLDEFTNGYYDVDENDSSYFKYFFEPENLFENGDTVTITYEDYDEPLVYTYYGYDIENGLEMEFARQTEDGWDRIDYSKFSIDSVQNEAWEVGRENCYFLMTYKDKEYEFPFDIVENPITGISFSREGDDPIEFVAYEDGYFDYDLGVFQYYLEFKPGDKLVVDYKESGKETYTAELDEYEENLIFVSDSGNTISESEIETVPIEEEWEPGEHVIRLRYHGRTCSVPVILVANAIKETSFERPSLEAGEYIEVPWDSSDGEWNSSFSFEYGDILNVTYQFDPADDPVTVKYEYAYNPDGEDDYRYVFEAQGDVPEGAPNAFPSEEVDWMFIWEGDSDPESWSSGEIHKISLTYKGIRCEVPVKLTGDYDPGVTEESNHKELPGGEWDIWKQYGMTGVKIVGSEDADGNAVDFGDNYSSLLETFEYIEDEDYGYWHCKAGSTYGTVTFQVTYEDPEYNYETKVDIVPDVFEVYFEPVNGRYVGLPGESIELVAKGHHKYLSEEGQEDVTDDPNYDYNWSIISGSDYATIEVDEEDHSHATLTFKELADGEEAITDSVGVNVDYCDINDPSVVYASSYQYLQVSDSYYQILPAASLDGYMDISLGSHVSSSFGIYKYELGKEPSLVEDAELTISYYPEALVLVRTDGAKPVTLDNGYTFNGKADIDIYRITSGSTSMDVNATWTEDGEQRTASGYIGIDGANANCNIPEEELFDDADGYVTIDLEEFGEDWRNNCQLECTVGLWDSNNNDWLKTYNEGQDYTLEYSDQEDPTKVRVKLNAATLNDAIKTEESESDYIHIIADVKTKEINGESYLLCQGYGGVNVRESYINYSKEEDREILANSDSISILKYYDIYGEGSVGTINDQYIVTGVSYTERPDDPGTHVIASCDKESEEGNESNYWWIISAGDTGTADITVTYSDPLDNDAEKSYTFTLTVTDEMYDLWLYTGDDRTNALPGKDIIVNAGVNHRRAGQEDTTEGITYVWSVDEDNLATIAQDANDPSKAIVTYTDWDSLEEYGDEFWLPVNVTVTLYDGEENGEPIERKQQTTTIYLVNDYIELNPVSVDGLRDLAVGESVEVTPGFMQYNRENEDGIDITSDADSFRWNYDPTVIEITDMNGDKVGNYDEEGSYQGSTAAQTFTIKRLNSEWSSIGLEAYNEDDGTTWSRYYEVNYIGEEHEHQLVYVDAVEPTCYSSGNIAYYECEECGRIFADANGETELSYDDIQLDMLSHEWVFESFNWEQTEDGYTANALFNCRFCEEPDSVYAQVTSQTEPASCEDAGRRTFTAALDAEDSLDFTMHEEQCPWDEEIPATGHDWGEPTYAWEDDYSAVTATRICNNCFHPEIEVAETTCEQIKDPTDTEEGEALYTATFENEAFTTQTMTVTIPAIDPGETEPQLIPETLWEGCEYYSSASFDSDMEGAELINVTSSNTDVIQANIYEDAVTIYDYYLEPVSVGTSKITVTYKLNGEEKSASAVFTVKPFPAFASELTVDGEEVDLDKYKNYFSQYDYTGNSPRVRFALADGWTLNNAYYYISNDDGDDDYPEMDVSNFENGVTLDYPEEYSSLNAFFYFENAEGEELMYGVRIYREDEAEPPEGDWYAYAENPDVDYTGGPVTLTVLAEGNYGTLSYSWYDEDERSIGSDTNKITVSKRGSYYCVVSDGETSSEVYFDVDIFPIVIDGVRYTCYSGNNAAEAWAAYENVGEDGHVCITEGDITIPETVTFAGGITRTVKEVMPFQGALKMTSIKLPSTIVSIEERAFMDTGLRSITIPSSVKEIGEYAVGFNSSYDEATDEDIYTPVEGFIIKGDSGSAAESYAKEYGITFIDQQHTHSLTATAAKAATCTEAGNSAYWSCSCGKYFSDADGKTEIEENSWVIKALGHKWGEWTQTKAPTCSAKGAEERVCANDSTHKETREVATNADAHAWDEGKVTTEPTCTTDGVKTFTCKNDASHTKTEVIAAPGHNMTAHAAKAATEAAEGNSAYWSCDKCGKFFSDKDGKTEIAQNSWVIPKVKPAEPSEEEKAAAKAKEDLSKAVDEAKKVEQGNYTDDSYKALKDAIAEAEALAKDENATKAQLDAATAKIAAAKAALKEKESVKPAEPSEEEKAAEKAREEAESQTKDASDKAAAAANSTDEKTVSAAEEAAAKAVEAATAAEAAAEKAQATAQKALDNLPANATAEEKALAQENLDNATNNLAVAKQLKAAANSALATAKRAAANIALSKAAKASEAAKTAGDSAAAEALRKEAAAQAAIAAENAKAADTAAAEASKAAAELEKMAVNDDVKKAAKEAAGTASEAAKAADKSSEDAKASEAKAKEAVDEKAAAEEQARQGVYDKKIPKVKAKKPASKKTSITMKWTKLTKKQLKKSKAAKYEIWLCPNTKFAKEDTIEKIVSKSKSSYTFKKLKKNTKYYVKVRAIRYVDGVKHVGKWSSRKTIKTKKK